MYIRIMENMLETTIKGLGFRAVGSPYDGESKGKEHGK